MKLGEALRILGRVDVAAELYPVSLLSGSTAEPLAQFLAAYLQERLPRCRVVLKTGLFGDLAGNLDRYLSTAKEPGVLLVEWADLDPRLGMRQSGGWGRSIVPDVLETVEVGLDRLLRSIESNPTGPSILITPPTLPVAPVLSVPGWQVNELDARCQELLGHFVVRAVAIPRVRVIRTDSFKCRIEDRLDLKSWWQAGFPYQLSFASELGARMATALAPGDRAKGLITDLDDTLWAGILGEVGVDGVQWDLEHHATMHGAYQQLLQSLAEDGVLVAVASKNDQELVEQCLRRRDMLVRPGSIFPVEAHWQPKVHSVARILETWNVGADSVVFIDDNALEIESVRAAFPTMRCRLFPVDDPDALWSFLGELNDLFGKAERSEEDLLRIESIRGSTARKSAVAVNEAAEEHVLQTSGGELTLVPITVPPDPRALDLLNKTNQFNLNGKRYTEAEWLALLESKGAVAWLASYRDKFGPLGRIAVLAGHLRNHELVVSAWVMSCRAFSRRIEHAMLEHIFEKESVDEIVFQFRATQRNTPLREFLKQVTGSTPVADVRLTKSVLDARKPKRYFTVGVGS